jgi:hypothetical protein
VDADRESGAAEAAAGDGAAAGDETPVGGEPGGLRDDEKTGAGDLGSAQHRADDLAEYASEGEDAPPA